MAALIPKIPASKTTIASPVEGRLAIPEIACCRARTSSAARYKANRGRLRDSSPPLEERLPPMGIVLRRIQSKGSRSGWLTSWLKSSFETSSSVSQTGREPTSARFITSADAAGHGGRDPASSAMAFLQTQEGSHVWLGCAQHLPALAALTSAARFSSTHMTLQPRGCKEHSAGSAVAAMPCGTLQHRLGGPCRRRMLQLTWDMLSAPELM